MSCSSGVYAEPGSAMLALAALCAGLHASTAVNVYVSSSRGDDASNGTTASPVATLPAALRLARAAAQPWIGPPYRARCAPAPATGCASGVAAGADSIYRGPGRVRGSCQQGVTPPALPALSRAAAAPATISLASGDAFELREALHLDARDRGLTITKWGASPHRPLISGGHTIPKWSRVAPDDAQQRDAGSNR